MFLSWTEAVFVPLLLCRKLCSRCWDILLYKWKRWLAEGKSKTEVCRIHSVGIRNVSATFHNEPSNFQTESYISVFLTLSQCNRKSQKHTHTELITALWLFHGGGGLTQKARGGFWVWLWTAGQRSVLLLCLSAALCGSSANITQPHVCLQEHADVFAACRRSIIHLSICQLDFFVRVTFVLVITWLSFVSLPVDGLLEFSPGLNGGSEDAARRLLQTVKPLEADKWCVILGCISKN